MVCLAGDPQQDSYVGDPLEREVVGMSLDPYSPETSSPLPLRHLAEAVCSLRSYVLECARLTDRISI